MKRITVPELRHIVDELKSIKDKRIENIYQTDDEIRFVIDGKELLFFPSSLHLTKPSNKKDITSFAMISFGSPERWIRLLRMSFEVTMPTGIPPFRMSTA